MRKLSFLTAAVLGLLIMLPEPTQAIPAFARKYGFNCNMCHTGFTKLNDFGQRVRDNGYQMPGQAGREKTVFQTAPPISLRTSAGLMASHLSWEDRTTSGFHLNGLDLLAAGVMHENISFLLIYTPRIDEPAADYTGNADGTNPGQPGALESANIVFSNLIPDALNLRVGRFEPAYHAFSSKRSYYLLQPYEVYGFETPGNSNIFDDNQIGVEAAGHFRNGFKYAAGVVNGTGANPDNNNAKDVYLNLFQTIGRGDGQSSGQRVGAFAYYGWQPTAGEPFVGPPGDADGKKSEPFYRIGGDVSLNWKTFNLTALILHGADDERINTLKSGEDYTFTGGFGRLDWAGLMNNRVVASVLFNWVEPPDYDQERTVRAYAALLRYYIGSWTAVNVALHAEYTYRRIGQPNLTREHQFAALVDFDF